MANMNWFDKIIPIIIIIVTPIVFIFWLLWILFIWAIMRSFGLQTSLWVMIEALSTALAAMTFIGASIIAYVELQEISRSRHLEIIDRLFSEMNSKENIEARRWIFQHLSDIEIDKAKGAVDSLPQEGRDAIKKVLNSLDRVAFIIQANWIPEKTIMPWMNPMVVKSWVKLKPYVEYESIRRKEPDYYQNARRLGQRCVEWRLKNLPDTKITWIDNAL
jgi:hypothetical protein